MEGLYLFLNKGRFYFFKIYFEYSFSLYVFFPFFIYELGQFQWVTVQESRFFIFCRIELIDNDYWLFNRT